MTDNPMKLGAQTTPSSVTTASGSATIANGVFAIIYNAGPGLAFVNDASATATLVFPTGSTPQNGTIIPVGIPVSYMKNGSKNTVLNHISDSTATIYIQSGAGV